MKRCNIDKNGSSFHSRIEFYSNINDSTQTMNSHSKVYNGKSTKFAIMVGSIEHFKAAILTADQLQKNNRNFTIEVVAVGKLVKDIAEEQTLLEDINKAEALGVKLTVCEVAMASNKVSKNKLDKRIVTIRNGWVYMFELQDKGYNTIST